MRSLLFLLLLSCTCIQAVYFNVTTCTDTTPCVFVSPTGKDWANNGTFSFPVKTIQHAQYLLSTATVPSTIVLFDGTYPAGLVWNGTDISLTSVNGSSSTFIDCKNAPNVRGLLINSGETSTTVISGITIQNCHTNMGAGIVIVGPTTKPVIQDVALINHQATNGAGGFIFLASPTMINVTVSGCNAANNGAGLFIVHNATAVGNTQVQAFSLAFNYIVPMPLPTGAQAYVKMSFMTFTNNAASSVGGAYFLQSAYRVVCDHCTYTGNSGSGSGCMAAALGSNFVVSNSILSNNQATQQNGGAFSIQQGSSGYVTNSSFIGNTAPLNGGAICVGSIGAPSSVNITNSLFDGNQANLGSVVYNDAASKAFVSGCTIRNNIAFVQGGILLLNRLSAQQFNVSSNTYENNVAVGNYGADYGSYAAKLAFIEPTSSTQIGFSGTTPSIYPVNMSTTLYRSVLNLDQINLKILLLDTFGQRLDLNDSNQTGIFPGIFSDIMTLDNITVPALLVQSTRVKLPTGVADVQVILVGQTLKSYAVTFSCDSPNVAPIRLIVTIQACNTFDYITYYESTNFPICHPAQDHHISDSLFHGILVLSSILIACVIIVQGLTIWYWNTPVFKGSTPQFMSLMLLGAILGYLATILSVLDVNHTNQFDAICKGQYWLMGLAFVFLFATLALKTWRIRNIFCNETLTDIRSVTTWGLFRILLLLIALEMLIHILWVSIDPLHSSLQVSNGGQLTTTCTSTHDTVFLIVNLVYKGLIAVVCVIFAYQTRDVASRFNESRQLMIASYNMFVSVTVIAALSLALPDADARRTVYAVGALFVITSTWFVLFMPKLFIAMKKEANVSVAGTTGSGGKNNSNSAGKTSSHSDQVHHNKVASVGKTSSKSSFGTTQANVNLATSASPTPSNRSKAGSVASTAPSSPVLPHNKLALNLTSRSSISNLHGPTGMSSPVGGGSPHVSALAMHMPTRIPALTLSRAPLTPLQIQEDETNPDHVLIETEPFPPSDAATVDRTTVQQTRRTSQPTGYTDMLEMGNINHTVRSIPPAKNFI